MTFYSSFLPGSSLTTIGFAFAAAVATASVHHVTPSVSTNQVFSLLTPLVILSSVNICAKTTFLAHAGSASTGPFDKDDQFDSVHRYLWWLGCSIQFKLVYKVQKFCTDKNTLIFIGILTVCIIRVAVVGMGIPVIITSFVGAS